VALAPLATVAALATYGIDDSDRPLAEALLASVSDEVRDAAGCPIIRTVSTVAFATEASRRIELPARPVRSVMSVTLNGDPLSEGGDYVVRGDCLWRSDGRAWHRYGDIPGELEVAFEHGYDEIPQDIVRMVCMYVAAGIAASKDGFEGHRGKQYMSIDDYREGYLSGSDEVVDAAELTDRTKAGLRARFGGSGPTVVGSIR